MPVRNMKRRQYEEQYAASRTPLLILAAIACFGASVLLFYIAVAAPQQGTAMGAIRDVMRGLGGSLSVALPLVFAWAGVLCILAVRGKNPPVWKMILDLAMVLALFAAVHVFFAERIRLERMTISGFTNFVSKSYGYGKGGGALGALLAWPFYRYLGVAGGFIAAMVLILLCLTATGRMGRIVGWFSGRADTARERRERRQDARYIEQEFDEEAIPRRARASQGGRTGRTAAELSAHARDPFSESVLGADHAQAAGGTARRRQPRRAAQESREQAAQRNRTQQASERIAARRRGEAVEAPVEPPEREASMTGPTARGRKAAAAIVDVPDAAADRPARADRSVARGQKRNRLYVDGTESREDATFDAEAAMEDAGLSRSQIEDMGFDADDFDGYDMLDAESILKDREESAGKRGFQPDRAASVEKARQEKKQADKFDGEVPVVKADRKTNVSIDDLKIEPEAYEEEDDEAPFDVPAKKKGGKAELPKIKRGEMKVELEDDAPEYNYPPIDLLATGETEDVRKHASRDMEKAQLLEDTLQSFGITAKLTGIAHGPAVTRFELQPAPGIKVSRITSLADDIALNLAAMSVRIEAPIPGKAAVGVEIPNDKVEMVRLRDVLESSEARKHPSKIAVGLGKDNSGRYIVADIAKMPHVLIAGQTGSGKSVCINAIIASILFRASPEEVRLILIDPKVVELSIYNNIPHLVCPVVTDPKKAASALNWAVAEMTKRYKQFAERGVRDIKGYNKSLKPGEKLMPQMVIIIDELADLMMVSPGEVEDSICRLAQLARACGMHLVIATQRPSVNVITGIIKANIPTRIAFSVASQVDSRTMIDHAGAEKLLGNGDMLFVPNGMKSMRVQGAWVSDEEVHAIVEYIKRSGEAEYDPDILEHLENDSKSDAEKEEFASEFDPKLAEAVDIVMDMGQASISMLQRRMRIGYARAGRLIDEMAQRGIVSEADGAKPRVVLITREQAREMFEEP